MSNKMKMKDVGLIPSSEMRIIEMSMNPLNGKILLYNGLEYGTKPNELELFKDCQFAERVRIFSIDAHINWLQHGGRLWNSLKNVKHANFQGDFREDVIETIISKCSNLETCSFTYWSAYDFVSIIDKITSKNLTAITAHVNGTLSSFEDTLTALHRFGENIESKLYHIFLIFKEPLPTGINFFENILERLGGMWHPYRNVCFLFQDEPSPMCMTTILKSQGFQDYGTFCFAENDPTSLDDTVEKSYESYKAFSKKRGLDHILIGCRKQPRKVFSVLPKYSRDLDDADDEVNYPLCEGVEERQCPSSAMGLKSFTATTAFSNKVILTPSNVATLVATECCDFVKTDPFETELYQDLVCCSGPFWNGPGYPVMIQKATFHSDGKFEFFSSNGFYFAPSSYEKCVRFLANRETFLTERFIFSSPMHIKSLTVPHEFRHLLWGCDTVELQGKWFTNSVFQVMRRISYGSKLVLMRMSLDRIDERSGRHTLSLLFDGLTDFARERTSDICCDGRDMEPIDLSDLTKALSEPRRPYPPLTNGLFFVHQAHEMLENSLRDFTRLMADGKPVTIICCEKNYELEHLEFHQSIVLVPRIFSNRVHDPANVLMKCFTTLINGHRVNIVVPF